MPERLVWTAAAWEDYLYWQGQDRRTLKRINLLIQDTLCAKRGTDHVFLSARAGRDCRPPAPAAFRMPSC
jgi:hypothetical protein